MSVIFLRKKARVYNRHEYRNEYLKSERWAALRARVMKPGVICRRCEKRPATDTHHLHYRDIESVKPADLAPLCRPCHDLVERAKKAGVLDDSHTIEDVRAVTEETLRARASRKNKKVGLTADLMRRVERVSSQTKRLVCGIVKLPMPSDFANWVGVMVTQARFDRIYGLVRHGASQRNKRWLYRKRTPVKVHY